MYCVYLYVLYDHVNSFFKFQSALGLNDHHQTNVINYMRFARYQRGQRLRAVDMCFQELKDSRQEYAHVQHVQQGLTLRTGRLSGTSKNCNGTSKVFRELGQA